MHEMMSLGEAKTRKVFDMKQNDKVNTHTAAKSASRRLSIVKLHFQGYRNNRTYGMLRIKKADTFASSSCEVRCVNKFFFYTKRRWSEFCFREKSTQGNRRQRFNQ
jgi:hypothetical protein